MTNRETAAEIRRWVAGPKSMWGWPTDPCGYDQHIAFVRHRNEHWTLELAKQQTFEAFCLKYADALERDESPPAADAVAKGAAYCESSPRESKG